MRNTLPAPVSTDIVTEDRHPSDGEMPPLLYWSRTGHVRCQGHVPEDPAQRAAEQWALIPGHAWKHRICYQCERCSGHSVGHFPRTKSL
jgi:hypothetical protein